MERYVRNLQLEGFEADTQRRLMESTVCIVGAGALGSVVAMYLAAAGVGHLKIADFDTVDISNLQRQVFFREDEAGMKKAVILADRIRGLNSKVDVEVFPSLITARNSDLFFKGGSVIAECSDNPSTKELCVDYGMENGITVVLGGVRDYEGQVAVFSPADSIGQYDAGDQEGGSSKAKTRRCRYTDIFPSPSCNGYLPCSQGGVFSPLPGMVASLQASEILKTLGRLPGAMQNSLLTFNLLTLDFQRFKF